MVDARSRKLDGLVRRGGRPGRRHRAAEAQFVYDVVEPNDSLSMPQVIPPFPTLGKAGLGSMHIFGSLSPGDVDYFQDTFQELVLQYAAVITSPFGAHPSLVALFDETGARIDVSSEGVFGERSPGTYTYAVTGAADTLFIGAHEQTFDYDFQFGWIPIPAPASAALVAVGFLLGSRRRRRHTPRCD